MIIKVYFFVSLQFIFLSYMIYAQEFINLDFNDMDSSGFAKGWHTKPEKINAKLVVGSGSQGHLLKIGKSKSFQQIFFQRQAVDYDKPKHFVVTARVKTKGIPLFPSTGILLVHVNDKDGTMIFYNDNQSIRGTNSWQAYTLDIYVPRNSAKITIGGGLNGKGTIWFDKFTIKEVPLDSTISMSEEARIYLDEAINIIQNNAIASEKIDFEDVRKFAYMKAYGAKNVKDTYPAIRLVIQMLADGHSAFITAEDFQKEYKVNESIRNADDLNNIEFNGQLIGQNQDIGYLFVPSFASLDMGMQKLFADRLQTLIKRLDNQDLRGWIVDLRQDNGGSNPAMLLGLVPLFDENEGTVFGYTDTKQDMISWRIDNGKVLMEDTLILESKVNYHQLNSNLPIAVLIGPITQSAGEAMAASFIGRPNTKLFGLATAGATHGNEIITLSDSSVISLSSGYLVDRNKQSFKGGIKPDVIVMYDATKKIKPKTDPVILEAILWLEKLEN